MSVFQQLTFRPHYLMKTKATFSRRVTSLVFVGLIFAVITSTILLTDSKRPLNPAVDSISEAGANNSENIAERENCRVPSYSEEELKEFVSLGVRVGGLVMFDNERSCLGVKQIHRLLIAVTEKGPELVRASQNKLTGPLTG